MFFGKKSWEILSMSHYEKLVADQINETKNILEFCNLKFEDNCVNYTNNNIPSKTISVYQVRSKIYKSSLNLSDKYLNYFPFLKEIKKGPLKKGPF